MKTKKFFFEQAQRACKRGTAAMLCIVLTLLLAAGSCEKPPEDNNNSLTNSSWATLGYGLGAYHIVCGVQTDYHFFDGDSTFNNHKYKKLYCYRDEQHSTRFYEGLIRKDNNNKIFFVSQNSMAEYLLYDFSVTEGMSFRYTYYRDSEMTVNVYVKKVDYVDMNGYNIKRIQLSSLPPDDDTIIDIWYDGIGSVNGFLNPIFSISGGGRILLCFYQNGTLIYHNAQFPNCYYDNAEEVQNLLTPNK
jgi:hypothetical protein